MEYNSLFVVNVALVCLSLSAIVVLLFMIHENNILNEQINDEVKEIQKKCPDCICPECPKNPDVTCPQCPKCPELSVDIIDNIKKLVNDKENENEKNEKNERNIKINTIENNCPTVDEIVGAIFPGRNPKVVDGGRYFQIDASNTYDGLSTSNFYEKNYKFPMDKILKPESPVMNSYNIDVDDRIDNSIENEYIDTNSSRKLSISSPNPMIQVSNKDSEFSQGSPSMDDGFMGSFYQKILPDNFN